MLGETHVAPPAHHSDRGIARALPTNWNRTKSPTDRPTCERLGAGNEARTRDLNLGKVALYQLSYSRLKQRRNCRAVPQRVKENCAQYEAKALS